MNAINIYITPIGAEIRVPDDVIKGVRIKSNMEADMRFSAGRAFAEWCKRQDSASVEAFERGEDYSHMVPV